MSKNEFYCLHQKGFFFKPTAAGEVIPAVQVIFSQQWPRTNTLGWRVPGQESIINFSELLLECKQQVSNSLGSICCAECFPQKVAGDTLTLSQGYAEDFCWKSFSGWTGEQIRCVFSCSCSNSKQISHRLAHGSSFKSIKLQVNLNKYTYYHRLKPKSRTHILYFHTQNDILIY